MIPSSQSQSSELIQNLFLSAQSKDLLFNQQHSLIVSPDFISILLKDATLWPKDRRLSLVQNIGSFFKVEPLNGLVMASRESECNSPIQEIVAFVMRLVKSQEEIPLLVGIVRPFISYYPLGLSHFKQVTQILSRDFHLEKLGWVRFQLAIEILKVYYESRSSNREEPTNFFYFYGEESGIRAQCSEAKWPFKHSLGFVACFQVRPVARRIYLFSVETSLDETIGLFIQKEVLCFEINNRTTNLIQLENFVWYPIQFEYDLQQGRIHLTLQETSLQKQQLPTLSVNSSRTIASLIVGRDFYGLINSPMIFNAPVPRDESFKANPYGFQKWEDLMDAKEKGKLNGCLFGYFPFCMSENTHKSICYDPVRRCHGEVLSNSCVYNSRCPNRSIGMFGGLRLILPLFYLGQLYPATHINPLEMVLALSMAPFRLKFKDLEQESSKCCFFSVMAHLVSLYDPALITIEVVKLIKEFKSILKEPKLKLKFFDRILWGLPIYKVKEPAVVASYYQLILSSYQNNQIFYEECYPLQSILYYMMFNLEDTTNACCQSHDYNEGTLTPNEPTDFHRSSYLKHLQAIRPIVQLLMSSNLKNDYKKGLEQVKSLLRLFLNKASTCFYLNLLEILESVLEMKDHKSIQASVIVKECNILPFLFHLAEKSINAEVIAEIIDILLFLQTGFPNQVDPDKIISFVAALFTKFSENAKESANRHPNASFPNPSKKKSEDMTTQTTKQMTPEVLQEPPRVGPETISSSPRVYNVIRKHYYGGSQQNRSGLIINQEAIRLIGYYYKIAIQETKQLILVDFLSELSFSAHNLSFLSSSLLFVSLICEIIDSEISKKSITLELALKIAIKILEEKVKSQKTKEFYVMFRAVMEHNSNSSSCVAVIVVEYLKKLSKKEGGTSVLQPLSQVCLLSFLELKKNTKQPKAHNFQPFNKMVDSLLTLIYEESCRQFSFIEQDDFETKFFPNILQQKSGSDLLSFCVSDVLDDPSKEEDVYLIFDNLLSKAQFETKIEIQPILRKHLYTIEVILILLQQSINRNLLEANFYVEYYLNMMVKLVVLFLCLLTNQSKAQTSLENNVLGRKVLFETLSFLFRNSQQPHHQECFVKSRNTLMTFVFQYIDYIDRILGRHTSLGSLLKRIEELRQVRYNPFLLELFEFFIRDETNKPLFTLAEVNAFVLGGCEEIGKVLEGRYQWVFTRPILVSLKNSLDMQDEASVEKSIGSSLHDKLEEIGFVFPLPNCEDDITQSILNNFDAQNPKEERTRFKFVDQRERNLRKVASDWRKLWTLMRIYHMPYGIWMNQRDSLDPKDQLKNNPLKNFRAKISKYLANNGSRPILSARIIQPPSISKDQKSPISTPLLNLNTLPTRSTKPSNLRHLLLLKRDKQEQYQEFRVIHIKQSVHIKGTLHIYDQYMIFSCEGVQQKDIHTSFSPFKLHLWQQLQRKWYFVDVVNIVRKRYLLQHTAFEIVFADLTSVLLAFEEGQVSKFVEEVMRARKSLYSKKKDLVTANKVAFCMKEFFLGVPAENVAISSFTEDWIERRISTFGYLMRLNFLSSRSYNDFSQYPVFPWTAQPLNTKSPHLRNLEKNMGSLGSLERIDAYKKKFQSVDPFSENPPYFFGTHYSSPGVVFNYLIRLLPFTQFAKQLQGGKFDLADRMFFSLESAWHSATKQISDVRELIPQYYYLPEMFLNLDGQRLGVMQSGQRVDDVRLPQWASNAYHLVIQLRQILESEEVSEMISNWIDLVFGYKQKGKEAEKAMNVFYFLTYENGVNLKEIDDEVTKTSAEAQIIHFGQCPSQLFSKPHPKRRLINKEPLELECRETVRLSGAEPFERRVGFILSDTSVCILYKHSLVFYTRNRDSTTSRLIQEIEYHRHKNQLSLLNTEEAIVEFFSQGKFMVVGGYLDGSYRIYRTNPLQLIKIGSARGQISCILITQAEDMLLLGTASGTLQVVEIQYEAPNSLEIATIYVQFVQSKVTHISENYGFFCISFSDLVSIYRITRSLHYLTFQNRPYNQVKFFRSFRNKIKVNGAILLESPLFSILIFDNLGLKCYSINGKLIATLQTVNTVQEVNVVKDQYLHDTVVVYDDGKLLCVSTPDLRKLSFTEVRKEEYHKLRLLQGDTVRLLGIGKRG